MIRPSRLALASVIGFGFALFGCVVDLDSDRDVWSRSTGRGERGSGNLQRQDRRVANFRRVILKGSPLVAVTVGPSPSCCVIADDNLFRYVHTEVSGDALVVSLDDTTFVQTSELRVVATTPELDAVEIRGSGDVHVRGLDGARFRGTIAGSGTLVAEGTVERVDVEVDGSGDVEMRDLQAEDARVSIRGSGDAELNVGRSLDADIEGSGDVRYVGSPPKVRRHGAGSGSIDHATPSGS
ncbi:MAG: DUF2807 domain-containing protein [Planctomycetes bacterium]|nr:DUF2807 domain-containing protein [Planctomycetota bacterium]